MEITIQKKKKIVMNFFSKTTKIYNVDIGMCLTDYNIPSWFKVMLNNLIVLSQIMDLIIIWRKMSSLLELYKKVWMLNLLRVKMVVLIYPYHSPLWQDSGMLFFYLLIFLHDLLSLYLGIYSNRDHEDHKMSDHSTSFMLWHISATAYIHWAWLHSHTSIKYPM